MKGRQRQEQVPMLVLVLLRKRARKTETGTRMAKECTCYRPLQLQVKAMVGRLNECLGQQSMDFIQLQEVR